MLSPSLTLAAPSGLLVQTFFQFPLKIKQRSRGAASYQGADRGRCRLLVRIISFCLSGEPLLPFALMLGRKKVKEEDVLFFEFAVNY